MNEFWCRLEFKKGKIIGQTKVTVASEKVTYELQTGFGGGDDGVTTFRWESCTSTALVEMFRRSLRQPATEYFGGTRHGYQVSLVKSS